MQQRPRGCLPPIMDDPRVRFSFAPRRPPRYVWGRQVPPKIEREKKEKKGRRGGHSDGARCLGTGRHPPPRPAAPCRSVPPAPPAWVVHGRLPSAAPPGGTPPPLRLGSPKISPKTHRLSSNAHRDPPPRRCGRWRTASASAKGARAYAAPSLPRRGQNPSTRGEGAPGEPVGPSLLPPPATTGGGAGAVAFASRQRGRGRGVPPPPHTPISARPRPPATTPSRRVTQHAHGCRVGPSAPRAGAAPGAVAPAALLPGARAPPPHSPLCLGAPPHAARPRAPPLRQRPYPAPPPPPPSLPPCLQGRSTRPHPTRHDRGVGSTRRRWWTGWTGGACTRFEQCCSGLV